MKQLSIKQLASYNKDLLKELPIEITRYNRPIAFIISVEEYKKLVKENKI